MHPHLFTTIFSREAGSLFLCNTSSPVTMMMMILLPLTVLKLCSNWKGIIMIFWGSSSSSAGFLWKPSSPASSAAESILFCKVFELLLSGFSGSFKSGWTSGGLPLHHHYDDDPPGEEKSRSIFFLRKSSTHCIYWCPILLRISPPPPSLHHHPLSSLTPAWLFYRTTKKNMKRATDPDPEKKEHKKLFAQL